MGEVQGSRGDICHCQHCQCTMSLSPFKNCIRDICPFDPFFRGNNCFKLIYLEITFTFYTYLWTSWVEATKNMESMGLLTGCGMMCFKYLGRVECYVVLCLKWMKIFGRYFHHEWGDCENGCFEVFWREGPLCKISTFTVIPFVFFLNLNLLTNIMSARKARKNRRRWK